MCGIAGFVSPKGNVDEFVVKKMTDSIRHRGPDGEGHWQSDDRKVCLGHRRLSIIDVTECGAQPMHYLSRYSIVFNGEIYNYLEIKDRLAKKGYQFKSTSDTEVILALYDEKKENCLAEMDGMFAFAIYDAKEQTVFLARDRFGEKPLFYCFDQEGALFFASEMKAFWAAGLPRQVNKRMLYNFLSNELLEAPYHKKETFYKDVYRFPAAHCALFSVNEPAPHPVPYWRIDPARRNEVIAEDEACNRFRELLSTSINRRLRSDVPLGSSLSGGLDSSLIVCLLDQMDKQNHIVRKTFSAQFPGFSKDESYYQQLVIDQCEVEPHFVCPTAASMIGNLQNIMHHQEEPFGSASICVQYEVFALARRENVTVLLDGQGADEILAGYHYYYPSFFNGLKKKNPAAYQKAWQDYLALHADNRINQQHKKTWASRLKKIVPSSVQHTLQQYRFGSQHGASVLRRQFVREYGTDYKTPADFESLQDYLHYNTTISGLETLLRYADRNSMAHSREVRLPFLFHELVEFLFTLPDTYKIREGWTKWIMRQAFSNVLPQEIAWRKEKIGYEAPQKNWLEEGAVVNQLNRSIELLTDEGILNGLPPGDVRDSHLKWKLFVSANTLFS